MSQGCGVKLRMLAMGNSGLTVKNIRVKNIWEHYFQGVMLQIYVSVFF